MIQPLMAMEQVALPKVVVLDKVAEEVLLLSLDIQAVMPLVKKEYQQDKRIIIQDIFLKTHLY